MKRKIVIAVIIIVCFLFTMYCFSGALEIASVTPNLMIVVTASFGFMRGTEGGAVCRVFLRPALRFPVRRGAGLLCADLHVRRIS